MDKYTIKKLLSINNIKSIPIMNANAVLLNSSSIVTPHVDRISICIETGLLSEGLWKFLGTLGLIFIHARRLFV